MTNTVIDTLIGTVAGSLLAQIPVAVRNVYAWMERRRARQERLNRFNIEALRNLQKSLNELLLSYNDDESKPTSEQEVTVCASCIKNALIRQHVFDWMDRFHARSKSYPYINDMGASDTQLPMDTRLLQEEISQEILKLENKS